MNSKIKWSSKIHPQKLVTLYQRYMDNQVDEAEVDDVGLWLFLRVRDILLIADHQLICPLCSKVFAVPPDSTPTRKPEQTLGQKYEQPHDQMQAQSDAQTLGQTKCPNPVCSFRISWQEYHLSWRHKELWVGKAGPCFQQYFERYPQARGINEKMIAIDTLIHSFHIDLKANLPNRTAANNLIEGNIKQVVDILDRLSGIQPENDVIFRETVQQMWERRRGI